MTDYKKVIKIVLIVLGVLCAAAAVVAGGIFIYNKIQSAKLKQKQQQEELEDDAYTDFEECCDACFSDSED